MSKASDTRTAILKAARIAFGTLGYHATVMNELVAGISLTRGALYYHFADKRDLFEAVYRELALSVRAEANTHMARLPGGTWERLIAGLRAYLELVSRSSEIQRILLIDAPTVLAWRPWRAIQSESILGPLADTLAELMNQGVLASRPSIPLARLIIAGISDAALTIAFADDHGAAYTETSDALIAIMEGLRKPRSSPN
ncbi:TetR family transcriptional regulator [Acidocella aquatica]|uniref:TetR family transcriptional regulator n=1 Tax=Acidocella aquatica TaxID=1922313 RepID=A0ABQ6A8D1_9PROT|nr:TetR/AcrR family transcriptional regulator [Acidocella aquatica]GLR66389.1 TetR family transcriptional regulator [Acidocella aquatica]